MTEREFWQEVYLATIKAGRFPVNAVSSADQAVEVLRERQNGTLMNVIRLPGEEIKPKETKVTISDNMTIESSEGC